MGNASNHTLRGLIVCLVSVLFAPCIFGQQYEKALSNFEIIAETQRLLLGEDHPDYAKTMNDIGYCHACMGNYGTALEYYGKAADIRRTALGECHPDYATTLNDIGGCLSKLGDFAKAMEYHRRSADIRRAALGESHPDYAASLNNIGSCYSGLGNFSKALEVYQQASDIVRSNFGEGHPDYAASINNIGYCHSRLGDFTKALECYGQASDIIRSNFGEGHPDYATTINNIGYCHSRLGDVSKALAFYKESLNIRKSFLGERHPDCVAPLRGVGMCEISMNDHMSAAESFNEFYSLLTSNILDDFGYLTNKSRIRYWDMYSPYFQYQLPVLAFILQSSPSFLQTAYDGVIFSKGLLLNAETGLRELILESGDNDALDLYDRFVQSKQQPPTDSLEAVCDALEKELMQKSKVFGDYTKNLRIKWSDVQSRLTENDIAIEFIRVPLTKDSIKYCALTLRKGYDSPHFVELFNLKDFKALSRSSGASTIYANPELYNMVWKPLEAEIGDCANIYFGSSGVLYRTAIEYADNGSGPLSDQKNIYRLSSTRQLATIKGENEARTAAIYGGLHYGAPSETVVADYPDIRGLGDGLGVTDLPSTLAEVNDIANTMDNASYEETLAIGEEGTESSFKALSGKRTKIIHVATHGFYWTGDEAEKLGRFLGRQELIGTIDVDKTIKEDKSLSRSGLLFAGANNALKQGYQKADGADDGILTAKEIAGMDLRGTDLVVLSACQTGLGEVSGEGVFGLQRGFKKAGANALLMSLWKVNDEATSILMRAFYDNCLTKGMDLQHALREAQKTVREYECEVEIEQNDGNELLVDRLNGNSKDDKPAEATKTKIRKFQSPRYWAGFVLLDATPI